MSDLHLEFQENSRYLRYNELPVTGDVLVLAGDIFYLKDKTAPVMNFWKWASKNYRQVGRVAGFYALGVIATFAYNKLLIYNNAPLSADGFISAPSVLHPYRVNAAIASI